MGIECCCIYEVELQLVHVQVPRRVEFVGALPRNAMGKVNKKALLKDYFGGGDA